MEMEIKSWFPDNMYLTESKLLQDLQSQMANVGQYIIPVSSIGDPSKGFIIYFPLILAINYLKGIKFLGAFIVCEWINMVIIINVEIKIKRTWQCD